MTISIVIKTKQDRTRALEAVSKITGDRVMVVTIANYVKKRSSGQNSLQWVSILGDFSIQGIINGKQFSANVWHEYLKEMLLPEEFTEGETLNNYCKWQEMPDGKLKLIGSTTNLTTLGFSNYIEKCYAYGTQELDIKFMASPGKY